MDKWEYVDKLSLVYHVGTFDPFCSVIHTHTNKSQSTGSIEGQSSSLLLFNVWKNTFFLFLSNEKNSNKKKECLLLFVKQDYDWYCDILVYYYNSIHLEKE